MKSFQRRIRASGNYKKTQEKAHGQVEIREYYQAMKNIKWLSQKKNWEEAVKYRDGKENDREGWKRRIEYRYFINVV
ncbi:MAG: hypothetical protein ACLUAR_14175 [Pilosibacter sp.]